MDSVYVIIAAVVFPIKTKPQKSFDDGRELPSIVTTIGGGHKERTLGHEDRSAQFHKCLVAVALEDYHPPPRSRMFTSNFDSSVVKAGAIRKKLLDT